MNENQVNIYKIKHLGIKHSSIRYKVQVYVIQLSICVFI